MRRNSKNVAPVIVVLTIAIVLTQSGGDQHGQINRYLAEQWSGK